MRYVQVLIFKPYHVFCDKNVTCDALLDNYADQINKKMCQFKNKPNVRASARPQQPDENVTKPVTDVSDT